MVARGWVGGKNSGVMAKSVRVLFGVLKSPKIDCGDGCPTL